MRILTSQAMSQVDGAAIDRLGIPSMVLMENAAVGVVDALAEVFPKVENVAIFCGPGNNGGDGLAVARHLQVRGYGVKVYLVFAGRKPRGDCAVQLGICRKLGLSLEEIQKPQDLERLALAAHGWDLVVDALFGTGLSRPLEGLGAELVDLLNRFSPPCLAVDLPSGLSGSTGEIPGPHLKADLTVTFVAPKVAHILPPAAEAVGRLVIADLGIPPELVEEAEGRLHLLVKEELSRYLLPRPAASHKGDYGHLVLVAGAVGKAGAAVLAAQGAVRAGAGLVTVAVPEPAVSTVDGGSVESMTLALESTEQGSLTAESAQRVLSRIRDQDALAVGPGLGQDPGTVEAIRRVVLESRLPLVLDADGINAFQGHASQLAGRSGDTVLTPHPGELGRLLGRSTAHVVDHRMDCAAEAAEVTGGIVVLKGHQSLVATPQGEIYVNPTGNPGMAGGGSGDVLTGMIGAFLAQGYEVLAAAQLGVYLHGLAGDLAAQAVGQVGLSAGDLLDFLPRAFGELA